LFSVHSSAVLLSTTSYAYINQSGNSIG
jgi:hypothetical protein